MKIARRIALVLLLAAGAMSGPVTATIYNFDMSGLIPSPTYNSVELDYFITIGSGSFGMECSVYGELNLVGPIVNGCASNTAGPNTFVYSEAEVLDGIFSINFSPSGSLQASVPLVVGVRDGVRTAEFAGVVPVPEAATLALLGIGLAGIGCARRRTLN